MPEYAAELPGRKIQNSPAVCVYEVATFTAHD
jgi:hypothetical protein